MINTARRRARCQLANALAMEGEERGAEVRDLRAIAGEFSDIHPGGELHRQGEAAGLRGD